MHNFPPDSLPSDPNQYSWGENYAGSSGLMSVSPEMYPMQRARSGTVSPRSRHTLASGSSSRSTFVFLSNRTSQQHCHRQSSFSIY